jgi:ABC-type multidrug transport system fused ATPase/permease subunit
MMLEIKDITFAYTDKPVIENISCTIESGQNIALIGRAAAEKAPCSSLFMDYMI